MGNRLILHHTLEGIHALCVAIPAVSPYHLLSAFPRAARRPLAQRLSVSARRLTTKAGKTGQAAISDRSGRCKAWRQFYDVVIVCLGDEYLLLLGAIPLLCLQPL